MGRVRRAAALPWVLVLLGTVPPRPAWAERLVSVEVVADPGLRSDGLERLIGLELGAEVDASAVREAVERLYQLDRFRSVVVRRRQLTPGEIALEFVLDPVKRVGEVSVLADGIDGAWVESALGLGRGARVDLTELTAARRQLAARLGRRGFREAAIGLGLEPQQDGGIQRLVVRVDAGRRTHVRRLELLGLPDELRAATALGLGRGDPLDLDRIAEASRLLERRLQRDGYLDARVLEPKVLATASPHEADLEIEVNLGPRVEVRVAGHRMVSRRRLLEDAAALDELGSQAPGLVEARERMLSRYHRQGYPNARVEVRARTLVDGSRRQVLFRVQEGAKVDVAAVRFEGVRRLEERELLDQIGQTVERFVAAETGRPGVDPEVVEKVLRSERGQRRRRASTAPPNAGRIYVERAYRAAAETLVALYRSRGFQQAQVGPPEVRSVGPARVEVRYDVTEGPLWTLGAVSFENHRGLEPAELRRTADLGAGEEPLTFERIDAARRALGELYRDRGYLFASVEERLVPLPDRGAPFQEEASPPCPDKSAKTCVLEVVFRISEGPQVRTRDLIVRGLDATRMSVIEGEVTLQSGAILSRADMVKTRDNLVRLGVFDRVVVRPLEEGRAEEEKDVLIEVSERENLSFELGVGASTEQGLRAFAGFEDRNLFGTALRLQLNTKVNLWAEPLLGIYQEGLRDAIRRFYEPFSVLGPQTSPLLLLEYQVAAGISYPRIFLLPRGFSFGIDVIALRDYDPAFSEENQRVTLIGNYKGFRPELLGRARPLAVQLRASLERSDLDCNEAVEGREVLCSSGGSGFRPGERIQGQNIYLNVGPRLSWDFRDDALETRGGGYLELELVGALGLDAVSPSFLRMEGRVSAYAPVAPRVMFVASLRGGEIVRDADSEIPLNRRFYAGGWNTIRGYPEKTLLPQDVPLDAEGVPISPVSTGGLAYLAFKTELRVRVFGPVSLAGFFDIGDLWARTAQNDDQARCRSAGPFLTECELASGRTVRRRLASGGGVGVRVATPIGPLAIDLGVPIDPRDSVEDFTVHFSVGTF